MAGILLPPLPIDTDINARPIEFGGAQTPMLGGDTRDMQRLGDRWSVDVQLPTLDDGYASEVYGARMDAKAAGDTLILAWPQPDFVTPIGAPVVFGADQAGSSLVCEDFTGHVYIKPKTFFSISDGSRSYLHMVTRGVTIGGAGGGTLNFWPMMRFVPADGAALEFAEPLIEGFIHTPADFGLARREFFNFASFTLVENK